MAEAEETHTRSNTDEIHQEAGWGPPTSHEPRWPASLAVVAALVLYVTLPGKYVAGPSKVLLPVLEGALLLPLTFKGPHRHVEEAPWQRVSAIVLIALINLANIASLVLLVQAILYGPHHGPRSNGIELMASALQIWLTNVIVFALWYWELDRGGPGARRHRHHREPDFLFPQMATPESAPSNWQPSFLDYVYVSFTNATAFSPTDTMPMTEWAKMLMAIQSLASLITIALVAARAVNILS